MDRVQELLTQHADLNLEIACYNGPTSFVVAGATSAVDILESRLKALPKPPRCKKMQVTGAFHSVLTEPLSGRLQDIADQLTYHSAKIPLETCSKGRVWPEVTPTLVASQTRDAVYFHEAVERISDHLGPCTWLEAGSASGASMLRRALGAHASSHEIKSFSLDSSSSLKALAKVTSELWEGGLEVQFWPFHKTQKHRYKILNLPPYQFDRYSHWLDWKESSNPVVEIREPVS